MKRLIIFGAVCALVMARPEQYKEKEDFQYSRSSSDDGTKSGFYGAQRGNMGGNYERAHNMDSLAQNQMSGLVRQVEGELGDGARTRTGSVYSAANSRGTYGSGHYDLGNLAGRNFQEGTAYGDSHLQSSQSASSAYNAAGYTNSRSQSSRSSGYQATGHSGLNLQSDDLQSLDNTQGTNLYDYGRQSSHSSGYNAQSGYQQHAAFDTSNSNLQSGGYGSNVHTRLISATPVRIIVRPGTRVAIPVAAQSYDITHGSSLIDQNSLNSDAEVLNNDNQGSVYRPNNAKHYESSYSYRKQWEKHDTIPSTVITSSTSTDNPFPKNSELYEDSQSRTASNQYDARRVDSQRAHSSNIYSGYNANVKSTSGQSRYNYDTQHNGASSLSNANTYTRAGHNGGSNRQATSSDSSLNSYNTQSQYDAGRYNVAAADSSSLTQAAHSAGFNADLNSQVENVNSKPKSYQSSYSYHKSWERQGDPYVIKPSSNGYYDSQTPQRLTSSPTDSIGYGFGSHQSGADCDENGHIRVARSYNMDQYMQQQNQNMENLGQQVEDLGQQSQNMEDLGQQSQNIEDLGQLVEDLGQQTQVNWGQQEDGQQTQNTWDNLEDLSQQSHNKWDEIQHSWDKFEDLGQKPQDINKQLSNLEQKNRNDLGQRRQDIETELKNNSQDQQAQNKLNFTNKHDQTNIYIQDEQSNQFNQQDSQPELRKDDIFNQYSHISQKQNNDQLSIWDKFDLGSYQNVQQNKSKTQSNHFNQQESQPELRKDDIFNQYSHISQKQNNDQLSIWDKYDLGSYQNVQQNKSKTEQANINQVNWSSILHTGKDQQPLNSGNNAEMSQLVQHNVDHNSSAEPFWQQLSQQSHKIPDTNEPSNTGLVNLNNQKHDENSFQETRKSYASNNWNLFSNSQTTYTDSYSPANPFEAIPPNTAPLSNIWNKLGSIEKQSTLTGIGNVDKGNDLSQVYTESQNASENARRAHTYHMERTSQQHMNSEIKPNHDFILHINEKDISQNKSNDTQTEKESFLDVGRGDIGPEDISELKPYKYPFDTPENVETIQNNKKNDMKEIDTGLYKDDLPVLSLNQQKSQDAGSQNKNSETNKMNTQHYYRDFEQHDNQDSTLPKLVQDNLNYFGQHENTQQSTSNNFGHHNSQAQRDIQNSGQERLTHLHDFGENVNTDQQNIQDFGQHENTEQQNLLVFGQHANTQQQNLQVFRLHENIEHPNIQDFGQQENLEQQNLQDFGQQENLEQQNLQDFGQQENLEQQNLQDFGQQENLEQQNLQDFGQQENLEQQNLQDFGQQENLEQQNLQDFGQQENLEQQNLQDFGHQQNLEQQKSQDFGQQDNLERQRLQVFGKSDNMEQQNLQEFMPQNSQLNMQHFEQDLKQQNLQNVGQKSVQDFKSQANLEQSVHFDQQNVQDFGQNENLEQQNLDQLGQHLEEKFKSLGKQETFSKNNVQSQTYFPPPEENEETMEVKKQNNNLQLISAQSPKTVEDPSLEPVTEKTGFWKSIGNKFSRAKSKIASWF